MKRFISAVLLSAAVAMPTMAQKSTKTLSNGYPFTQVPFTSVKISQNTFWGARLKAAREVTVPLAFSKCESDLYKYSDAEKPAYSVTVNGKAVEADLNANKGYLPVKNIKKGDVIRIHFDMPVRTVVANGKVADDKGKVAVERGPLVYCAEAVDNQNEPVLRAVMAKKPAFSLVENYSIENTETKGAPAFNVKAIQTSSQVLDQAADGTVSVKNQNLTLIPYYAWNHRGANQMNVWFYQNLNVLDK